MRPHSVWLLLAVAAASSAPALATVASSGAGIDYPSVWACDRSRFNWYCDREPEPPLAASEAATPDTATPTSREDQALERIESLQKALKAKRALAIVDPTPDNLKAYIAAQEAMMNMGSVFSDVWRRVVWQNPDLNYELKRPTNNAAIATYAGVRKAAEKHQLADINREWGVFFFFRSDCPYCHRLAPTLRFLTDTYGITVLPVSVDGGGLPEYPNPQRDNGLVDKLGIRQVPMLVLGNVRDKRLVPLASGLISAQDVIERIYVLTGTRPGELY